MMKLLIFFMFTFQLAKSEVYFVTFIKGNVKLQGAKLNLKVGDKISDNDKLVFADQQSKISCISPVKGRFDILGSNAKTKVQMEWVAVLKDVLLPSSVKAQLSTRSILEETNDPAKIFKSPYANNRVLIIESEKLIVDGKYPLDNKHFFFVQYEVNGKVMLKMVPIVNSGILLDRRIFVDPAGNLLELENIGTVSFCYQDAGKSKELTKFIPSFISLEDFTQQVFLLKKNLSAKNQVVITTEIYNHFVSNYGFINYTVFENIMNKL